MKSFAPRFEKLPVTQRRLWPTLRPAREMGYVLYGGTAVSLQLGHRRSVDFDFFTGHALELARIREAFGFSRVDEVLQQSSATQMWLR